MDIAEPLPSITLVVSVYTFRQAPRGHCVVEARDRSTAGAELRDRADSSLTLTTGRPSPHKQRTRVWSRGTGILGITVCTGASTVTVPAVRGLGAAAPTALQRDLLLSPLARAEGLLQRKPSRQAGKGSASRWRSERHVKVVLVQHPGARQRGCQQTVLDGGRVVLGPCRWCQQPGPGGICP